METIDFEEWGQDTFNLLLKADGTGIFRTTYWTPYDEDNGFITWTIDGDNALTLDLPDDIQVSGHMEGESLVLTEYYGCTVTMAQRNDAAPVGTELTTDKLMGSWIADRITIEGYESDPREEHLLIYLVCGEDGASVYWNEQDGMASFYDEYMDIYYNWTPLYYDHEANSVWCADLYPYYNGHREFSVTVTGEKEAEMLIYFYSGVEEYPTVVSCHLIPASPKSVVKPEPEPVTVDSVAGLIMNLREGATILLEPGTYNVTEYLRDHPDEVGSWSRITNEYYAYGVFNLGYDEPELMIAGMKDLTIMAARPGEKTEIVCEPRQANVLTFKNCTNVTLDGITMGHTPEKGTCAGSVLSLDACGGVFLSNMDLYGCGAYGITAYGSYYVVLENSVIRECTYGCVAVYDAYYVFFQGDEFRDCTGYNMLEFYNASADFSNCVFSGLEGDFLSADENSYISFSNCEMDEETRAFVENLPGFDVNITGDWESAVSAKG